MESPVIGLSLLGLLAIAALLLVNAIASAEDDRTRWVNGSISDALRIAGESDRMTLLYCWEDENDRCVSFYEYSLKTDAVMAAMEKFVCFSAKKGKPEGDEAIDDR